MPDGGFRTITVTDQLYERVKRQAKKNGDNVSGYVSEVLRAVFKVQDSLSGCTPLFRLVSIGQNDVVVRDEKKDMVIGVKVGAADGGKVKLCCELDGTDYCQHTAFAEALPQVRNAIRR
jgi:hypothetical protein